MELDKSHFEIIERSHQRSVQYGIEREQTASRKILSNEAVTALNLRNQALIEEAKPLMDHLYNFLSGTGYILVLTDHEGCILELMGDEEPLRAARSLDMVVGAYMDERSIGTNAMGTAISEDAPVQISAKEHFITAYHRWTCSAAPIHDEGQIVGTLNLTGASQSVHPHTLGIVVAAVRSLESSLVSRRIQQRLMEEDRYSNAITHSIAHGILAVNGVGIIGRVNHATSRILGVPETSILNRSLSEFIDSWEDIFKSLQSGAVFEDEEITLTIDGKRPKYLVSASSITGEDGRVSGMVLTLKEIQKIFNLVNRYSGMRARYTIDDLIGDSPKIKNVVAYARQVADSSATILIQGESGTGKEVLAQAIHNRSSRKNGPFVAINCGAIHRNLIESELFGYEEGSFTGAKKGGQPGKFELASGGTLFLDEIGEMPLELQVSLLRVLQEGYVTRVGGNKWVPVDVRIIAATNRDLKREIERGNFRQDLYYRIGVIPIQVPALRDRREDIPMLAEHFLSLKAAKLHKTPEAFPDSLFKWMVTYSWPGNIRELENFIEKYLLLGSSALSEMGVVSMLPSRETPSEQAQEIKACSLEQMEQAMIRRVLAMTNGNMTKTAEQLGISRNTLYLKIKKYQIEKEVS